MTNPEDMRGVMDRIPLGAKIAVLVAWAAGSLSGGGSSARHRQGLDGLGDRRRDAAGGRGDHAADPAPALDDDR
jgi:hypothetical protein